MVETPDSKDEPQDVREVVQRSKRGFLALTVRTFLIYALRMASVLVLAWFLIPEDYGVFALVNSWISVSMYFLDLGVLGALIQQKDKPTQDQLRSGFGLALSMGLLFFLIFFVAAPFIVKFHGLRSDAVYMIWLMGLSPLLMSFRVIPRVVLDRQLNFGAVMKAELGESVSGYAVQIGLAVLGLGAWAMIIGSFARNVAGTGLFVWFSRQIKLPKFSYREIRPLLRFGIPFQANAAVPALSALVVPLVLGTLLQVDEVGLITWSLGIAAIPLALAFNYNQVVFPSLSRLQDDRESFGHVASRGIQLAVPGFAALFGLAIVCGGDVVLLIFPEKWIPAIRLLPYAMILYFFYTMRYLGGSILNATGKPATRLKIESLSVVLDFTLAYIGTSLFQSLGYFAGISINYILMAIVTAFTVKHVLNRKVFRRVLSAGVAMAGGVIAGFQFFPYAGTVSNLLINIGMFLSIFLLLQIAVDRSGWKDFKWVLNHFRLKR